MPSRILLLRHAETSDPSVFHGAESDVGLSARGERQAAAVAGFLVPFSPVAVVSSAMRRAVATASVVAGVCQVAHHRVPELHERKVGALSGTPTAGSGVWPATYARWLAGDTGFAPDGAESFDDMKRRIMPAWERVAAEYAGRTVAVVLHGIVIRVILTCAVHGGDLGVWDSLSPVRNVEVHDLTRRDDAAPWAHRRIWEFPPE